MSIRTRFNPLGTIGRKGLLPSGYIELEYLESTGTQWIDTGFKPGSSTVIKGKTTFMDIAGAAFGVYEAGGAGNTAVLYISALPDIYLYTSDQNKTRIHLVDNVNTPFTAEYSYDVGAGKYLLNGNTVQFSAKNNWVSTVNMPIFCRWLNGYGYNSKSKIYYFKMYDAGKLVRNFIPALDPTGRPCMFDTVTRQPFYNKGTGEFNFGYKLPEGYTVVEYLEGTGTQYIDTGVDCTSNTGVEFKAQMLSKVNAANAGGIYYADGQQTGTAIRHHCTIDSTIFYWYGTNDTISKLQVPVSLDDLLPHEITINPVTRVATFDSYSVDIPQFDPFRTETNYYLFSRLNGATGAFQSRPSRIYYFKLFNNGRLVRSFIPTLDASNRPCMYDLVKRKTYYNAGTGEFLYG